MTINSSTRIAGPYTGNGSTTAFPFSFKVFGTVEVTVVQTNLSLVETTLTLGTNYTVALNANQNSNPGGTVNMVTAPAAGFKITLTSSLTYTQTLDLTNQGGFYPSTINDALDRATIQIQQLNEQVGRAAKVNISSGTDSTSLVNNINTLANNLSTIQSVNANQTNINNAVPAATSATTSAASASSSASSAASSATIASAAQVAADAASIAAVAAYDSFDDRYLGAKSSNPTLDNDGNALLGGALYFNTAVSEMRLYNGSIWNAAYVPAASSLLINNNLSDLQSASTARTNLGLGSTSGGGTVGTGVIATASVGVGIVPTQPLHLAAATTGPILRLENQKTAVASADTYGNIEFYGNDTSTNASGVRAKITAYGTGTTGNAEIRFYASAGSTVMNALESLRITASASTNVYVPHGGILCGSSITGAALSAPLIYNYNVLYVGGGIAMDSTDTQVDVDLTAHFIAEIYYSHTVELDVAGHYCADTVTPVFANNSRLFKQWVQNVHWNGTTYVIAGAVLKNTVYNSDATNFPAGAVNVAKVLLVVSATQVLLRLQNRTTPGGFSSTGYSFQMKKLVSNY